MLRGLTVVT